ncbi:MAG TPA: FHA domain-containing protein [Candidatus Rubrimentiphilum sp.]|nr:FHA domain-containing protein [Candidatus Rubrimentiphilum sp.]
MTFPAQMRIGSLEILAGLAIFGAIVGRHRFAAAPSGPENMIVQLAVDGRALELGISEGHGPRVIGRSSDADVPLADPEASRRQAALQTAAGAIYVTDLGSRNGTFLNGKRLADEGIELKVGDHIDVGNTRIEVLEIRALP